MGGVSGVGVGDRLVVRVVSIVRLWFEVMRVREVFVMVCV